MPNERSVDSDAIDKDDLLDSFEASLGELGEGEEGGRQISLKRHVFISKEDSGR